MDTVFRHLPSVDKVISDSRLASYISVFDHEVLVSVTRDRLEAERRAVASGKAATSPDDIIDGVAADLKCLLKPNLRRVINASGVIIHTNLGRAPLSRETLDAMDAAGEGYSNLEFDLENGVRGSRHVHVEELLCRLSGAEAAIVVNNTLRRCCSGFPQSPAAGKSSSRAVRAVEIGGGFRIPDVMRQSGAKLVEVGTTNCTYGRDFAEAVTERTVALMRIHSSNFKLVGFVNETPLEEIVAVAKKHDIIVLDDLGSGCFLDTTAYGLAAEPMVQQSVKAGVALTFFSGDKLVGGPQAGIVVGQKEYIDKLKKHPLARATRMDKSRLAGLAGTLRHYLKKEATKKVPVWRMIATPLADIELRANAWATVLGERGTIIDGETMVGGGSLPGGSLPTKLVAIRIGRSAQSLARRLRLRDVPVIGRIDNNEFLLDPRTVLPEEDDMMLAALSELKSA
jgi:L-seryl-tRNA(Ser) seleniumtransferase